MKFNVGDVVRVKSLEWYEENKDQYGEVGNFVEDMSDFCGTEQEITSLYGYAGYFFKDGSGWVWDDSMLEDTIFTPTDVHAVVSSDPVNHPDHYTMGAVECLDAIESATTGLIGIEAVCTGQIIKYTWRWKYKNGKEDLEKARFYLDKLIRVISTDD